MSNAAEQNARNKKGQTGAGLSVLGPRIGFIIVVACLLLFGLVMLYSASSIYSYNQGGSYTSVFSKQVIFVALGVVVALIIALIPYKRFSLPLSALALVVTIPLLALVLIEGNDALGARRWIDLGFTTLQPSEFTKIALILVLAHLVERCRSHGYSGTLVFFMVISCAIPVGLIIIEPDLGTTIIAFVGILAVLWFGGIPKRVVGVLALVVLVLGMVAIFGTGFRQARIASWLNPESDPLGDGYQLLNSYYAFGEGGIFGVGLGLSKQKFSWLPQSENDFLFAIVGEELGLLGALVMAALFMSLVIMALRIARSAPDATGAMIAGASGVIIGAQAFLNMLCVVGAMPTTGKPLPFFSAGGSSVITTMILVGLVLSVSRQSHEANVYDFRREQFTVVNGGGALLGGARSVLSRLPNPVAARASAVRSKPQGAGAVRSLRQQEASAKRSRPPMTRGAEVRTSGASAARTPSVRAQGLRAAGLSRTTGARSSGLPHTAGARVPNVPRTTGAQAANAQAARYNVPGAKAASASMSFSAARSKAQGISAIERSAQAFSDKVVPISRARANKNTREAQAEAKARQLQKRVSTQQASEPQRSEPRQALSLSLLRRNRVRKSGGGAA